MNLKYIALKLKVRFFSNNSPYIIEAIPLILEDSLDTEPEGNAVKTTNKINKANCIKRLVSKKKRRIENENFDLDMAFITKRVIAMGYPSVGCEKFYRNSITDIMSFFERYHKGNVKIYNLCRLQE